MKTYRDNEQELIEKYIDTFYYPGLLTTNNADWRLGSRIDLIVRPDCNQKCEYCYLYKHMDELYPQHKNITKNTILNNLKLFLDICLQKKIIIPTFDLFAGELYSDNILYDLLDEILLYIKYIRDNSDYRNVFNIIVPTNVSFLNSEFHMNTIESYKIKMLDFDAYLTLSISTDGPYSSELREGKLYTDEFVDKMFTYAVKNNFSFHPMISPNNVEHAIDNLHWWVKMYKKYNVSNSIYPMMLFVRDSNWDSEKVSKYQKFIEECWECRVSEFNGNLKKLAQYAFSIEDIEDERTWGLEAFDPCKIPLRDAEEQQFMSCGFQTCFPLYLGDLSIPACHRLAYPQFTAGKFCIEEGCIRIEPKQVGTWIQLKNEFPLNFPVCQDCDYNMVCLKGCLGAQFEYSGEILYPIPIVCQLFKCRFDTITRLLKTSGVLQYALDNDMIRSNLVKNFLISHQEEV